MIQAARPNGNPKTPGNRNATKLMMPRVKIIPPRCGRSRGCNGNREGRPAGKGCSSIRALPQERQRSAADRVFSPQCGHDTKRPSVSPGLTSEAEPSGTTRSGGGGGGTFFSGREAPSSSRDSLRGQSLRADSEVLLSSSEFSSFGTAGAVAGVSPTEALATKVRLHVGHWTSRPASSAGKRSWRRHQGQLITSGIQPRPGSHAFCHHSHNERSLPLGWSGAKRYGWSFVGPETCVNYLLGPNCSYQARWKAGSSARV
jgi:hypothetical protein